MSKAETFMKENKTLLLKGLLVVAVAVVLLLNYDRITNIDIRGILENTDSLWKAAVVTLIIYAVKGVILVFPSSVLHMTIGIVFPTWIAIGLSTAGKIVELTTSYLLGLILGGDAVVKLIEKNKKASKWLLTDQNKYGDLTMIAVRFFGVPIDATSVYYGGTKYPFGKYMLMSMIGLLPRVICETILGSAIYNYLPSFLA